MVGGRVDKRGAGVVEKEMRKEYERRNPVRMTRRKYARVAAGLCLSMMLLFGCVQIPYGYEQVHPTAYWPRALKNDEAVIYGERLDDEGRVVEQFLKLHMRVKVLVIGLTPEGVVLQRSWYYSRYALDTPEGRKNVWQIAHFPMLSEDPIDGGWPVAGSDRWVFTKVKPKDDSDQAALRLVLYSPREGIVWDKKFRRVDSREPWKFSEDGRYVIVNALDREKRFLVAPPTSR